MAETKMKFIGHEYPHDSAQLHVTGEAVYVDDILLPENALQVYVQGSTIASGKLKKLDLKRVKKAKAAIAVIEAADIPGENNIGPVIHDEPVFADKKILFMGQPLFAVAAETLGQARTAAKLAKVQYEEKKPILTIQQALKANSRISPDVIIKRGRSAPAIKKAAHKLNGTLSIGGQDHFYLEGQVSLAVPQENGQMLVYCSTQHVSEVQELIARALDVENNGVIVETRRMGGAFGGKETQAAQWAVIAALIANETKRPANLCLDRDSDMIMTGKRHDFFVEYKVGFSGKGIVEGIDVMLASRCGCSADLSGPINDRAIFHVDNSYYLKNITITSKRLKTNTVSNTAFRGFGGPQGMIVIERIMDEIAFELGLDPTLVRSRNLYGKTTRNTTPYGMRVSDNVLPELIEQLKRNAIYTKRRKLVEQFNQSSPVIKRGISLTPVKFGISFTTTFLNQAGALVHVYKDGSIHVSHGGTEMGQGLFIKVAQVVAEVFQIDPVHVKPCATRTDKIPNTSATAASSGSDINGMAAKIAAEEIKQRLIDFAVDEYKVSKSSVKFAPEGIKIGRKTVRFKTLAYQAYLARVFLSAQGFYATPKIHYDADKGRGRPFYYFAYGAAVSEVAIDSLTGETKVLRADILHDCGQSLNPAIDMGQIEGGFIQGMGWLTTEELFWDETGQLQTHAPSTYKIPTCSDVPDVFNVKIWKQGKNIEQTIYRSKAVGEPPLMLAISVYNAIAQAIAAAKGSESLPQLDTPATPERILLAISN